MKKRVLVATLGESPVVVTAMFDALRKHPDGPGVEIDEVFLLYPGQETARFIGVGAELIQQHFANECRVVLRPLPFEDAETYENSVIFLRELHHLLEQCRHDAVYLSIAGGRKNMAALAAVITQFHPCIEGLYHLLDRNENDSVKRHFYTIEELDARSSADRQALLRPAVEDFKLISLPFAPLTQRHLLAKCLPALERGEAISSIPTTEGAADAFFTSVFSRGEDTGSLDVWLSSQAIDGFRNLGPDLQQQLLSYVQNLSRLEIVANYKRQAYKGFDTDCQCYPAQRSHSKLRVFFSWDRNQSLLKIHCVFLHGQYEERCRKGPPLWAADYPLVERVKNLGVKVKDGILIVPLGLSPMVASQTFALLSRNTNISKVIVVYPADNGRIRNGVRYLRDIFGRRENRRQFCGIANVSFHEYPVPVQDVDSTNACRIFANQLMRAIEEELTGSKGSPIYLSLTGGRKAMAVITYFAAQRAGLKEVYHTLVTDPELEARLDEDTGLDALKMLKTTDERARRMFLDEYREHLDSFHCFSIPVIRVE